MPDNIVLIGLGSNLDPEENIAKAKGLLGRCGHIIRESALVRTAPLGITNQPDFLNGTLILQTELSLEALKSALKGIEDQLGRKRKSPKSGPRTIDLDIVVWNNKLIDKDFYSRDFLKKLTLELLPDLPY